MLHKYLLKKIGREIEKGNYVLHLSDRQEQITEILKEKNFYTKISSLHELENSNLNSLKGKFGYLIADMDKEELDDFDKFMAIAKSLLINQGTLIIIAANLATYKNALALFLGNDINLEKRPYRAISPGYLRKKLLGNGFAIKNRFWTFDDKKIMMAMATIK